MSAEERVRYDRQIRLWGLTAQQRLMQTCLTFHGINGAASEVAKNMVLAGVKRVTIVDSAPVTDEDLHNSFLLQPTSDVCGAEAVRQDVACARLHALNPFVAVACGGGGGEEAPCEDSSVVLVQATSLALANKTLERVGEAKLAVVSFSFGDAVTFSLFFTSEAPPVSLTEALRRALSSSERLADMPASVQQVVLALHLADRVNGGAHPVTFAENLQRALALVEELHLFALTPQHVENVLSAAADHTPCTASAVSATVAGASIAQYLIQLISDNTCGDKLPYRWMLCDTSSMDVQVGDL